MFENMEKKAAHDEILKMVSAYCDKFHKKKEYEKGDRIPYASRVYDHDEMVNLVDSALEFWLTSGRYTDEFEEGLSKYLGVSFCCLVNSGSSANLLAFMALTSDLLGDRKIKRGDEVITVAAGFPTTVTPIIQYGAVPVFVDVDIPSYNINANLLEAAYSDKTKAVMLAHTLGNPFNLEMVKEFCQKHNLWLIEDNCDALGSEYWLREDLASDKDRKIIEKILSDKEDDNVDTDYNAENAHIKVYNGKRYIKKKTGTIGDIGTSSFYPPHHMTMGEGGAVYTDNPLLNKIIRSMRDWGRDCVCKSGHDNMCGHRFDGQFGELPKGYDHKYVYSHFGYNLKATDLQASIGCAQLKKFPQFVEKRRENFDYLYKRLENCKDKLILPACDTKANPSWFGFAITCKEEELREKIVQNLESHGIQTRMLFAGNLLKHPCFDTMRKENKGFRVASSLDNTDRIMRDTFWIGVYPGMNKDMLDEMADRILEVL